MTDMSAQEQDARRTVRKIILDTGNEELRDAYYKALTLAEHEAQRRERDACAHLCDVVRDDDKSRSVEARDLADHLSASIRARGQQ